MNSSIPSYETNIDGEEFMDLVNKEDLPNTVPTTPVTPVCDESASLRTNQSMALDQHHIYKKGEFPSDIFREIEPINPSSKRNRLKFKRSDQQQRLFKAIEDALHLPLNSVELVPTNQEKPDLMIYDSAENGKKLIGSANLIFKDRNHPSVDITTDLPESDRYLMLQLFNFKDLKKKADVKCAIVSFFASLKPSSNAAPAVIPDVIEKEINETNTLQGGRRVKKRTQKKTQKKKKAAASKKRAAKTKRRIRRR